MYLLRDNFFRVDMLTYIAELDCSRPYGNGGELLVSWRIRLFFFQLKKLLTTIYLGRFRQC